MTARDSHSPHATESDDARHLDALVARLPRELPPPPEAWHVIAARHADARWSPARVPTWATGARLAVAGLALVALSSAATLFWMSGRPTPLADVSARADVPPSLTLARLDGSYAETITRLEDALQHQRGRLSPATIEVIERSLETVDRALADAREALAADPANATLRDLVVAGYETKIRLLRQAMEARHAS
jgi:hypothetical protein